MSRPTTNIFPMDETMCKDCSHRLSRVIVPLDLEEYDIDLSSLDLEDGEDILIEQHICMILREDLDGVVQECNKFANIQEETFFYGNPYN